MPPLCLHLSIAKEAAGLLRHPLIDQNMASYLIGTTSPDVHIIAGSTREETHFFNLEDEHCESGVKLIFEAHPNLAKGSELDAATRSFVTGYLSHLVTDEIWILDIYRPFFGHSSPLGEDPMANMVDRLLQFELDRREREDRTRMDEIQAQIRDWEPDIAIGFLGNVDLRQWRDFICAMVAREPTLAPYPLFDHRFLASRQKIDPKLLEEFLPLVPVKLEWAIQYVSQERLTAFREKAVSQSVATAREYLDEDS